ncbi:hypothetical protein [Pseudomonas sp. B22129]|uniref:hypothetical protein n=1 Tax=Pseudomonas sp. B22129 TaxID=3235111 RepID=UPI003784FB7E
MTHELSPCNNCAGASAPCSCHDCREQTFVPGESRTITVKRTSNVVHTCEVTSNQRYGIDLGLLIAPKVLEENNKNELVLLYFSGDAHVFVEKGGLLRAGERAWLTVSGMGKDGVLVTLPLMNGDLITSDDEKNGLTRAIPRAKLLEFPDKTLLTITFKVSTCSNSCDNELIVYPEQTCTLRKPYRDETTFDDQTLGKWVRGPGAADPTDLSYLFQGTGFILKNMTWSTSGIGIVLWRSFHELEINHKYRFSIAVRRGSIYDPLPILSLRLNDVDQTAPEQLADLVNWKTLFFDFVVTSLPVTLAIYSHQNRGIEGNDTDLDNLLVEEIP